MSLPRLSSSTFHLIADTGARFTALFSPDVARMLHDSCNMLHGFCNMLQHGKPIGGGGIVKTRYTDEKTVEAMQHCNKGAFLWDDSKAS